MSGADHRSESYPAFGPDASMAKYALAWLLTILLISLGTWIVARPTTRFDPDRQR